MRKNKFKVWDEETKRMYSQKDVIVCFDNIGEDVYTKDDIPRALYDYKLMQYTGIKDINGNEIYEGDIVEVDINDYGLELIDGAKDIFAYMFIGVVKFYEGSFSIDNDKKRQAIPLFSELNVVNVIGNIYENKDLLG